MIKINLLSERKQAKVKSSSTSINLEGGGGGRTLLLAAILIFGLVIAGGWWWMVSSEIADWTRKHEEADRELERLVEIRKKGDAYKAQKELLEKKVHLITELKKRQEVPVHIIDQVSKNLPEFLWLESMSAKKNRVSISGKATNYNAVSNFYENLNGSGLFGDVNLGRVFEVPEGVAFSLTCNFTGLGGAAVEEQPQG